MDSNRIKDLHRRYLTRELSAKELQEFFVLLGQEDNIEMADMDEISREFPTELSPKSDIVGRIMDKQHKTSLSVLFFKRAVAAVFAFIVLAAAYQTYQHYRFIEDTQTFLTVKVPQRKMTELTLADGTKVSLTSGSVFKYPKSFSKTDRQVFLIEGQAYFDVAHDKTKPFHVNSGKLTTTALGTSFIIKHYKDYGYEKVSLYTGKVKILRNGVNAPEVILNPGQEFDYHNGTLSTVMGFDNSKDPLNKGVLDFNRTPFRDAVYSLASFYGVKIRFNEDQFKDFSISGDFGGSSITEVLHSLEFIYPFKVTKTDSLTYNLMRIEKRK
ncbi:FecR family protein [Pedobacter sp. UBA5917]|jgi:ferric-dicitrate binding protein FerR (iron transport regulator)|uniref:FecR family protein n=1 Tax=Pedobacter sp. UBA5917 TaxID=1947061 RepID=UPI0025E4E002|nr:FecR domain-containing protein [Pedobacter sp. UBA5917]